MFSTQGRISRSQYWLVEGFGSFVVMLCGFSISYYIPFLLFYFVGPVANIINPHINGNAVVLILYITVSSIVIIPFLVVSIITTVKRLHDREKSGLYILILLVPIAGLIYLFVECGFLAGTTGQNFFGEDPLQLVSS